MTDTGPILVVLVYAIWFLASVAGQIPAVAGLKKRVNILGVIPNWFLFTGGLVTRDCCLYHRSKNGQGIYTNWQRLSFTSPRPALSFLWHPQRFAGKSMLDLCAQLVSLRLLHRDSRHVIPPSIPYQTVLRLLRHQFYAADDCEFQFCFMLERDGAPFGRNPVLFLSDLHR
jgi:hypothetical protein